MRNTSLRIALALAMSFAAAGTARVVGAQDSNRPDRGSVMQRDTTGRRAAGERGRHRKADARLLRGITLTDNQKVSLKAMRTEQRKTFASARREARGTSDTTARRAGMQHMREQHATALRSILTPAQRDQFDRNVTDWKAKTPKH